MNYSLPCSTYHIPHNLHFQTPLPEFRLKCCVTNFLVNFQGKSSLKYGGVLIVFWPAKTQIWAINRRGCLVSVEYFFGTQPPPPKLWPRKPDIIFHMSFIPKKCHSLVIFRQKNGFVHFCAGVPPHPQGFSGCWPKKTWPKRAIQKRPKHLARRPKNSFCFPISKKKGQQILMASDFFLFALQCRQFVIILLIF